jgi:dTDP-4-amino-4,6-dideoxygalactose transaminase
VPFVDLGAIHDPIRAELLGAIEGVVSKDGYILGPEVAAFETEVADYLGVAHAIGVSSGTDALLVALMALDVGAGDDHLSVSVLRDRRRDRKGRRDAGLRRRRA